MLLVLKEDTELRAFDEAPKSITRTWYLFGLIPIARSVRTWIKAR